MRPTTGSPACRSQRSVPLSGRPYARDESPSVWRPSPAGIAVLAVLGLGSGLAGIEHVLAFTLGLVAPALARRSRRPAL